VRFITGYGRGLESWVVNRESWFVVRGSWVVFRGISGGEVELRVGCVWDAWLYTPGMGL
jgi:hypothetical protein